MEERRQVNVPVNHISAAASLGPLTSDGDDFNQSICSSTARLSFKRVTAVGDTATAGKTQMADSATSFYFKKLNDSSC